jgi:hypothetical protein
MERIERDVMELHSKMNNSNETIDITFTIELLSPNLPEIGEEYPKDYYYIFQITSKNYLSEEEFRDKIQIMC